MQGEKIGLISGYYPDVSPINQASLRSGAVDNTRDDANATSHFGKKKKKKNSKKINLFQNHCNHK